MNKITILFQRLIFFAAFFLPLLYLLALIRGFYFSGDTVSFLQFATAAKKLIFWDVFLIHGDQWPPLPAISYNLLQILPGGFITEQKSYLIIFFLLILSACFLLVKDYYNNFSNRLVLTSLILFSSLQVLILRVSLADIQFMAGWLWAVFFLDKFLTTKQEKYAALYIIPASLIPLTRYAGFIVTLVLSCILLIFSLVNYRTKKFSIYFIILAFFFTLLPFAFYLFRNFMIYHELFGYYDPQFAGITLQSILLPRIELIIRDIALPFLVTLILGTKIIWRRNYISKILLYSIPIVIYMILIVTQQLKYRVTEFIPSRYTSPFYPILLLVGLFAGSWLASKFNMIKKIPNIIILLITFLFFSVIYYSSLKYFITELGFSNYRIPEAQYSYDLQSFCNTDKKKFLFLQYDSRHWVAHSLYYFCRPITWITMTSDKITLPKDSVVFSPYELTLPQLKKIKTYHFFNIEDKVNINLYLTLSSTELNIKKELAKLNSILE